ncbi:hypothetical protein [Streptomyces sp. N35]|uniref:hypothetical protein n=1 Tax=Streptomyces sp. N35 TaxID=2795730 RepID=UPI0018F57553|nr:hypothetical protein [Streptomyces sp. N35]
MITAIFAAFLIAHGLIHLPVWAASGPAQDGNRPPFDARHSWALAVAGLPQARAGRVSIGLASAAAMLYVIAGAAVASGGTAWATAAVIAAVVGLALKVLWFHPWLSLGVLLDVGVLISVYTYWPASLY